MVPERFIFIKKIPYTRNNKVDYKELELLMNNVDPNKSQFKEPSTEIECQIAGIWREYLQMPKVGLRDNFFDIGGNSLIAIKFILYIKNKYTTNITFRDLINLNLEQVARKINNNK